MLSFAYLIFVIEGASKLTLGERKRSAMKPRGIDPGEQEMIRKHS